MAFGEQAWSTSLGVAAGVVDGIAAALAPRVVQCAAKPPMASMSDVVEASLPCTVRVQAASRGGLASSGSGFFVSETGHCVTNHHVVEPALRHGKLVLHLLDGSAVPANVVAFDEKSDIAVLKVAPGVNRKFPFLRPGRAADLRLGEPLAVLGAPLGGQLSVSVGALGARIFFSDDHTVDHRYLMRGRQDWSLLQVDSVILQGNSGGPIVNGHGEVVGVAAMGKSGGALGSLGYAVSIDQAWPIVQELLHSGHIVRGRVGMRIEKLPGPHAVGGPEQHLLPPGVDVGLFVSHVLAGSPAHAGGVQAGDIVTHINGRIANSKGAYFEELGPTYDRNKALVFTIMRPEAAGYHSHARSHAMRWRKLELHVVPAPDTDHLRRR